MTLVQREEIRRRMLEWFGHKLDLLNLHKEDEGAILIVKVPLAGLAQAQIHTQILGTRDVT